MSKCVFCDQESGGGQRSCPACGGPLPEIEGERLSDELFLQELWRLVESGQRIKAIAALRRRDGVGLDEAIATVTAIERDHAGQSSDRTPLDSGMHVEILERLQCGDKIGAIKQYRESTGVGLRAAKDAVEALAEREGLTEMAGTGRGCVGMLLMLVTLSAALCWNC